MRIPAPVFDRSNWSAYSGSSGETAAKNMVSTSTTAATSQNNRRIPPMLRGCSGPGRMPEHAHDP